MKLLIIFLALFAAIAYAFPINETQETKESPLSIVDLEPDSSDYENGDVERPKRQFGLGG